MEYNKNNIEITRSEIECMLRQYNVQLPINNIQLYKRAFIHHSYTVIKNGGGGCGVKEDASIIIENVPVPLSVPVSSVCENNIPFSTKSNERLEFIGDGILECITKLYLYRRFPHANEGFMTEKKIALVKNEAIGKVAYDMGLQKWFILSKQSEEKNLRNNLKTLGCLFEALVGAIYLDFNNTNINDTDDLFNKVFISGPGYQITQLFIESIFEQHVDWNSLILNDENYKNILQVKIQKEFKTTPGYLEIQPYNYVTGFHMGVYLCLGQRIHNLNHSDSINVNEFDSYQSIRDYVKLNNKVLLFLGQGTHRIKKKAEQIASLEFQKTNGFLTSNL